MNPDTGLLPFDDEGHYKRKRDTSSEEEEEFLEEEEDVEYKDDESVDEPDSTSDDDGNYNYNKDPVVGISRSGRKVVRPRQYAPGVEKPPIFGDEDEEEPPLDEEDEAFAIRGRGRPRTRGRGRGRGRGRPMTYEEYLAKYLPSEAVSSNVFCSACAGGESPLHNRIVLCDACDSPYHQQCHYPPVEDEVAEEAALPWFCHRCAHTEKAQKTIEVAKELLTKKLEQEQRRMEEQRMQEEQREMERMQEPHEEPIIVKRRPGRPRKYPREETKVIHVQPPPEINKKMVLEDIERCLACGQEKHKENALITDSEVPMGDSIQALFSQKLVTQVDAEVSHMVLNEAPVIVEEKKKQAPPENPEQVCEALLRKMCSTCHDLFGKQLTYVKRQPQEVLYALLFQTAVRYNQLSDLLYKKAEADEPLEVQQLLAYSARSRFIALPTQAAIRMLSAPQSPHVNLQIPGTGVFALTPSDSPLEGPMRRRTPHNYGSYEDMIARALAAIGSQRGCKPKDIFNWMEQNIPGLSENFRASATQALKKGVDRAHFLRIDSGWYKLNPDYQERKPMRRDESQVMEHEKERSYVHQNAAAALASMQSQQQPPFGQPMMMHPVMPYPHSAAMAAAFAAQPYLAHHPHFMQHLPPPPQFQQDFQQQNFENGEELFG